MKPATIPTKALLVFCLLFVFMFLLIIPQEMIKHPRSIGEALGVVRILGTNAPFFNPPLTNFSINQSNAFFYDVNCTDLDPLDPTVYTENFTGFAIDNSTGIINVSGFNQSLVGNHSIHFTCNDSFGLSDSAIINFEIIDTNEAPVLSPIGPQIAVEGEAFFLDVDATDPDLSALSFNAVTALFSIDSSTGIVSFIPTIGQIGNYTINFTVFDGEFYDFEIVSFRIVRGPFCGDDSCGSSETCATCPGDCGVCPDLPSTDSGGESSTSGEGGQSATTSSTSTGVSSIASGASQAPLFQCEERWECSDWSACSLDGLRSRNCLDLNRCNTQRDKPISLEQCEYQPTCFDGLQNGGETGVDCGGPCEPCLIQSCFDGLQNQGETGVDCGGPCKVCQEKEFTKAPFLEIPGIIKLPRSFPWLLLLIILIINMLTIVYDQYKIRKLRKLPFEEYQEEIRKYRPKRRKLYKFVLNTSFITLAAIFYIYIFSNDYKKMIYFSFIPIGAFAGIPFAVAYLIRYIEFHEYQYIKKVRHLKKTHIRELLQLIRQENEMLHDMEAKLKDTIMDLAKKHEFDDNKDLYTEINTIFEDLSLIRKKRESKMNLSHMTNEILDKIIVILESKNLQKACKEYPEYLSIKKELQYIEDNRDKDTSPEEDDLLEDIKELGMPYMKVVNESDKGLGSLYNALVDIYQYYMRTHGLIEGKDSEIMQVERSYSDKVKALSKKAPLMTKIQQNNTYARVYNGLVDLFNHYSKKHQLSKSLENV